MEVSHPHRRVQWTMDIVGSGDGRDTRRQKAAIEGGGVLFYAAVVARAVHGRRNRVVARRRQPSLLRLLAGEAADVVRHVVSRGTMPSVR